MPVVVRLASALAIILLSQISLAQEPRPIQPPLWSTAPDVMAFERMENAHLAAARRAVDQIAAVKVSRTIDNTLVPYDDAIRQIDAASNFSALMQQVHPDASFRDHATAMTTKASEAMTSLSLNRGVYRALASLDASKANAATRHYIRRQLLEFRLAGVDKDDSARRRLKQLNDRLTADVSRFDRNIADDPRVVEVTQISDLAGLPQDFIDNHKPDVNGRIQLAADETDFPTVMNYAESDDLRRQFWEAFNSRAYPKNREVLQDMLRTRFKIATLLGYPSWADYNAADKMIESGPNIAKFIEAVNTAARPAVEREEAMLLAEKRKTNPGAVAIFGYEYWRLAELVRRAQFDFDEQTVRPYFAYDHVKQGVMDSSAALFHVSFRQELSAPAWSPSVETWDVMEEGKMIGRFYLDMHPRPGKYAHGEMRPVLDGIRGKQLPEAVLICNFPEPTASDAGLMEYDDVVTFFHEFGHLMHHILGGLQQWAGISGMSMEDDFVEVPSQMLEEWVRSPQILASFARDYKNSEPIPADLVVRMNRAAAFGRAINKVAVENAYSAISFDIHNADPEGIDLDAVTLHDLGQWGFLVPLTSESRMYANFNGLARYSSAYYTYLWDKVIAEDLFQEFDQNNLLAGDTPMRYRRTVLDPGGSMSAHHMVENFLGRPSNMIAFKLWLGEEFSSVPQREKSSGTNTYH
jgi:thimet oligopeptidase